MKTLAIKAKRSKEKIPNKITPKDMMSNSIASDALFYIVNCLLSNKWWILLDRLKVLFGRKELITYNTKCTSDRMPDKFSK